MVTVEPSDSSIDLINVRFITRGGAHTRRDVTYRIAQNIVRQYSVPREENVIKKASPLPTFDAW